MVFYHSLWKNKQQTWTQSAPEIHIDKVVKSNRQREIRSVIWRKNHGLDFPSFYLELAVIRALSGCMYRYANNVHRAMGWIADNLETAAIEDPSNTSNIVSDDLTAAEKKTIAAHAAKCYAEPDWDKTLW